MLDQYADYSLLCKFWGGVLWMSGANCCNVSIMDYKFNYVSLKTTHEHKTIYCQDSLIPGTEPIVV